MSLKRLSLPLLLLLLSPVAAVATDLRDPEIARSGWRDLLESTEPATRNAWRVVSSTLLTPTEPVPQGFFISEIRLLPTLDPPSVAEFRRFSPEGEQLDLFTTEIPSGSALRDIRWDGAWKVEWRIHINRLVIRTDGRSIVDAYQVSMRDRRVAERGSEALQVWITHEGRTRYEMTAGEPVGEGRPLVEAPHPEVLIDGDEDDSHFAALWYEPWHEGGARRYFVGISPKDQSSLEAIPFADDPMEWSGGEITAGVAMGEGIAIAARKDRDGLWFRRLSNEGAWLDPAPVNLARGHFAPDVFVRSGVAKGLDGFVVTWSE
ncbi:MAG: hypothetical protein LC732_03405, partial [Acidobacteria bacterium]|nr:hypothetical protein [Acidobacteriota bacterium]